MTRQPIREAYEETGALRRECPMCDAGPGQWCIDPRGRLRRVPCVLRTRTDRSSSSSEDVGDLAIDFSEPRRRE